MSLLVQTPSGAMQLSSLGRTSEALVKRLRTILSAAVCRVKKCSRDLPPLR